jgi:hypothetical protein
MKKLSKIFLSLSTIFMSFSFLAMPLKAQEEEMLIAPYATESELPEVYWDGWDNSELNWEFDEETGLALFAFMGTFIVVLLTIGLATYIYFSLALMTIAKRLQYENTWWAWVPVLSSVLLFKMGDQNPLLLLLLLVPGVGQLVVTILSIIATMKICEKRGYDKLLGLLVLVPLANLILYGMLAWGNNEK